MKKHFEKKLNVVKLNVKSKRKLRFLLIKSPKRQVKKMSWEKSRKYNVKKMLKCVGKCEIYQIEINREKQVKKCRVKSLDLLC